jgi:hypothetical protein
MVTPLFLFPAFVEGMLAIQAHAAVLQTGTPTVPAEGEPPPVHRATWNLQRDLKEVFGVDSLILHGVAGLREMAKSPGKLL